MWNIAPYGNHEDLYTVQDNLSKVHGNHLFKAGLFLGSNEKVESSGAARTGQYCLATARPRDLRPDQQQLGQRPDSRYQPEPAGIHGRYRKQHRRNCRRALA